MRLNTLSPDVGSKKNRRIVGRGIGSGLGKTCGKGHKGQKARAGGFHKINFEGGQMPIQRRLPKMGFKSRLARITDEVNLSALSKLDVQAIDLDVLKAFGLVAKNIQFVKVIHSGELSKAVHLKGIRATVGARRVIEELGGSVE